MTARRLIIIIVAAATFSVFAVLILRILGIGGGAVTGGAIGGGIGGAIGGMMLSTSSDDADRNQT